MSVTNKTDGWLGGVYDTNLRLACTPLARSAAFVRILDLIFDFFAHLWLGVLVFFSHLESGTIEDAEWTVMVTFWGEVFKDANG